MQSRFACCSIEQSWVRGMRFIHESQCGSLDASKPLRLCSCADDANSMASPTLARSIINNCGVPPASLVRTYQSLNFCDAMHERAAAGQLAFSLENDGRRSGGWRAATRCSLACVIGLANDVRIDSSTNLNAGCTSDARSVQISSCVLLGVASGFEWWRESARFAATAPVTVTAIGRLPTVHEPAALRSARA